MFLNFCNLDILLSGLGKKQEYFRILNTHIVSFTEKIKFIEIVIHFSTTVFSFFLKLYNAEKRFSGRYITFRSRKNILTT